MKVYLKSAVFDDLTTLYDCRMLVGRCSGAILNNKIKNRNLKILTFYYKIFMKFSRLFQPKMLAAIIGNMS